MARRFLGIAQRSVPETLSALGADDPERARLLESVARHARELLLVGVPKSRRSRTSRAPFSA